MPDQPGAGSPDFLDGQLDAELVAAFAVVEDCDRPGNGGSFVVTYGMVVEAVVHQPLHTTSQALRRGERVEPPRSHGRFGLAAATAA